MAKKICDTNADVRSSVRLVFGTDVTENQRKIIYSLGLFSFY